MAMSAEARRALYMLASLVVPFVGLRLYLLRWPDTDLNVGPYNVHHLYTGVLLMMLGGLPLALFRGQARLLDAAAVVFGVGLSLALDEWVYLIATDGSNQSYLLPVSLWGGVTLIGLACGYLIGLLATSAVFSGRLGESTAPPAATPERPC